MILPLPSHNLQAYYFVHQNLNKCFQACCNYIIVHYCAYEHIVSACFLQDYSSTSKFVNSEIDSHTCS